MLYIAGSNYPKPPINKLPTEIFNVSVGFFMFIPLSELLLLRRHRRQYNRLNALDIFHLLKQNLFHRRADYFILGIFDEIVKLHRVIFDIVEIFLHIYR